MKCLQRKRSRKTVADIHSEIKSCPLYPEVLRNQKARSVKQEGELSYRLLHSWMDCLWQERNLQIAASLALWPTLHVPQTGSVKCFHFCHLQAAERCDFPVLFAFAAQGWMHRSFRSRWRWEAPGQKAALAPPDPVFMHGCPHFPSLPFWILQTLQQPGHIYSNSSPHHVPSPPKVPKLPLGIWTAVGSVLIPPALCHTAISRIVRGRHAAGQQHSPSDGPKRWGLRVTTCWQPRELRFGWHIRTTNKRDSHSLVLLLTDAQYWAFSGRYLTQSYK